VDVNVQHADAAIKYVDMDSKHMDVETKLWMWSQTMCMLSNKYIINKHKLCKIALVSAAMILMLVSIASAAPYAYITNYGDNEVSVIDTATKLVGATVSGLHGPWGVAVNPNGKNVYVTNLASNNVSVINTKTNTVTAQVPVGNWPYGVAVTPDGTQVYVANYGGVTVSVINPSTNTVATTVPVGNNSVAFGHFTGKTAPTILWNNPANIVYDTPLSSNQLSANASDPISGALLHGTFIHTPPLGTVLSAGMHTLQVDFIPDDAINYTTASANVIINVVLTPAQKIQQMTSFIQDLVTSDELDSQSGIALIAELQDTKEYLSHGYTDLAIVNLKNFIHQTKIDISYGVLSANNRKILIDGANDVISPALTITKSADPITYNAAGQPITYTYTVTNSGNMNLSDIKVTDTTLNQQISISNSNLVPGQSTTGTIHTRHHRQTLRMILWLIQQHHHVYSIIIQCQTRLLQQ
jgi:uncharacterized repeat protein (TIGR01451 family)